jgi:hypothetical protein
MINRVSEKGRCQMAGVRRVRTAILLSCGISAGIGSVVATEYDLSPKGPQSFNVPGDVGGTAIVRDYFSQPTGTGVFDPFLTLDSNGQTSTSSKSIESAYNTDGHSHLYLDQLRPEWNTRLTFNSLADIKVNGNTYYGFLLDANEPDGNKRTISIDNIRIYTSATDNTASVGNNINNLNNLGTLRWALNDPMKVNGNFNVNDWIKLDASQENIYNNANGGQGQSDMLLLVPASAFDGAKPTDYVWFYDLNGVQCAVDKQLAAQAGYEEWRYVSGPHTNLPDGGATVVMLGIGLFGLAGLGRPLRK